MWIGAKNYHIIKSMWSTIYNMFHSPGPQWSDIWLFCCPNSHDKLAKSKFGSISINLNIVQNNMFIIKGVVSGHYSHISQFTYKCIMWTVIINEDDKEGRYVYRSDQAKNDHICSTRLAPNEVISISINLNIVQNNVYHKRVVSGHYSHTSQLTAALQLLAHLDGEALNVALLVPEGQRRRPVECFSHLATFHI